MTSTTFAQEQAFKVARDLSQGILQEDIAAAHAGQTGAALTAALLSAHRCHYARVYQAAVENNMSSQASFDFLTGHPKSPESFSRSDNTAMTLIGGRYNVTGDGTFDVGGGTITLEDASGNIFATFTEAGSAIVDLRYGVYTFEVDAGVTDLAATLKTGVYVGGVL